MDIFIGTVAAKVDVNFSGYPEEQQFYKHPEVMDIQWPLGCRWRWAENRMVTAFIFKILIEFTLSKMPEAKKILIIGA